MKKRIDRKQERKSIFKMVKEDIKQDPIANLVIPVTTTLAVWLALQLL